MKIHSGILQLLHGDRERHGEVSVDQTLQSHSQNHTRALYMYKRVQIFNILNIFLEFKEKRLQLFCHVNRMDRATIPAEGEEKEEI
jgi:hypothetical protein